jgi:hydrogenase maturation protein HypF
MIVAVARAAGHRTVLLTGGCFQNAYLAERTIARLTESGFTPAWHRRVPPNDGGLALGQILAAAAIQPVPRDA